MSIRTKERTNRDISRFVHRFRLSLGAKFTRERMTFTLTDSVVLLAGCWFVFFPAVFLAGIEGRVFYSPQHDPIIVFVIGVSLFSMVFFGQRRYRDGVQKRIAAIEKAHRETIQSLAGAINAKDEATHDHVQRVQIYAAGVARALGCSAEEIEALRAGALLHDIGEIAVPDHILNKPGKLTAAEFEKVKIHTLAGAQILSRVEFPYPIVPIVRHHHERWDGSGYPDGLAGEDIPLTARILSVVDCFDALREDRKYRKGLSRDEAVQIVLQGSGLQYDPRVVATFIAYLPEFEAAILASCDSPLATFAIEPSEQLTEAARLVPPAAGLADEEANERKGEHRDELIALCDVARAVMSATSSEKVVSAFTDALNHLVPYNSCAITLIDPISGNSSITHASGQHRFSLLGRGISPGKGITGWVLANRKPFCNADPKLDLPISLIESADYRTLAAFPIIDKSMMYGVVTVYSSELSEYTQGHQRLMRQAVALVATALAANSRARSSDELSAVTKKRPSTLAEAQSVLAFGRPIAKRELTH